MFPCARFIYHEDPSEDISELGAENPRLDEVVRAALASVRVRV
jgi:hypothetical protein